MNKQIIVRADDLGFSEAVNYGIAKSVKDGIVGSVGLMPNMPSASHGLKLLKGENVCLGQHTNICVGKPLTDPTLIPSLVQENGDFKSSKEYREASKKSEDFVDLNEAILEIEAQYNKFKELTGSEPEYFEGHAVSSPNFFKALEIVANRHHLPYLGFTFNEPVKFKNTYLFPFMESIKKNYNPFETLQKAIETPLNPGTVPFLILHPGYLDDYILSISSLTIPRTKEVAMAVDSETFQYLKDNDIELIQYSDIK